MNIENSKPAITIPELKGLISVFFISRGFTEVETPLTVSGPVPEPYIDFMKNDAGYLRPSPEIEMKILLTQGYDKIFQTGTCFRKGEKGRLHKEEFTMLEWYEAGADYNKLIDFTKEMLLFITSELLNTHKILFGENVIEIDSDWDIMTVSEAFAKFADISPEDAVKNEIFEDTLVNKIEPNLSKEKPVILKDYPAKFAALSKLKDNDKTLSERWELYLGGIEISNTYSELTDSIENRDRFAKFAEERKRLNKELIPINDDFFKALEEGLPESSGSALGIDRLAMILNNYTDISDLD